MNKLTVIFILITVFTVKNWSYLIKVPTQPVVAQTDGFEAPGGWVHLQKLVLPLFENVCEESPDPVVKRLAQSFSFDDLDGEYSKPNVITILQKLKAEKGFLSKGEIFTEYNPDHMNELRTVYEVMYYANNFDTFYKAAAWARQNLNCGLFVNAIYLAIQNRRDTDKLSVPAPYEVLPNYFIQKDVILQASKLLASGEYIPSDSIHDDGNTYTLDANYTAIFYDNDDESKLAYFREDIGLNAYYFLRKLKQDPWLSVDINSRYGENMYQMMKQLMARYNLERYSNGFSEINSIGWNSSFDIPYDPMLIYANGNEFIHRSGSVQLPDNDDVALLRTIENNIGAVVNHMINGDYNKTQILNHLMEIIVTGDKSYENLAHRLLGKDQIDSRYPSILEHYMTSLRDPIFWIINKKMVEMVDNALQLLPPYSRDELLFPGVEIVNIDVKKMMTVFDYYEFDVTDALKISGDNTTFQVKIGQPRLNHKPFSIKLNISSLVSSKGLIKVYLGPKVLPGELAMKKNNFVLLDSFEYNFKPGTNIVSRTSDAMKQFSKDFMSISTIRKRVQYAEFGLDSLPLLPVDYQVGYPDRLILPKGTPEGLPLQLFVFVAPFTKFYYGSVRPQADIAFNSAIMNPGYPLDLSIESKLLLGLPNVMLKDVILTHKSDSKVENYGGSGVTKKWYGTDTYDASSRMPKEPFDYASKKVQFGNKGKNELEIQKDELNNEYDNKQDIEQLLSNSGSSILLTSKAKSDYLKNKKDTQTPLNNYPFQDEIHLKNEKPLYKSDVNENINELNIIQNDEKKSDVLKITPINDNNYQNSLNNNTVTPNVYSEKHLLRATAGFDYATKKKERESYSSKPNMQWGKKDNVPLNVDYKTKKDQYIVKPNTEYETNIEITSNNDIITDLNNNMVSTTSLPIKNDGVDGKKVGNSFKEIINTEDKPNIEDVIESSVENLYRVVPIRKLIYPNMRNFSVYDYIVHALDPDDNDYVEKVYE